MTTTTSGNVNKTVRLVVVMDPISDIKPVKDTTLAMLLAIGSVAPDRVGKAASAAADRPGSR